MNLCVTEGLVNAIIPGNSRRIHGLVLQDLERAPLRKSY